MIIYLLLSILLSSLVIEASPPESGEEAPLFRPFTAKIIRKKVRLRLSPNLDSPVIRELFEGDLILVDGENGPFYRVVPPSDLKLYLFRTFVLDGMIEGNKVNVRAAPDLESPIVAQLSRGDLVEGEISSIHPKWLEINPPVDVRFYVAKEFVVEQGDETYLNRIEERRKEVNQLLSVGDKLVKEKMEAPFEEISLEDLLSNYQLVLDFYPEFSSEVEQAKEAIRAVHESYLRKKVSYLESKQLVPTPLANSQSLLDDIKEAKELPPVVPLYPLTPSESSSWAENETKYLRELGVEFSNPSDETLFYESQRQEAISLKGIVEPYLRPVKKKPGNFVLIEPKTEKTIAYLYSTKVNLLDFLGEELEVFALPRPNNGFALPAYFVLEVKLLERK